MSMFTCLPFYHFSLLLMSVADFGVFLFTLSRCIFIILLSDMFSFLCRARLLACFVLLHFHSTYILCHKLCAIIQCV